MPLNKAMAYKPTFITGVAEPVPLSYEGERNAKGQKEGWGVYR